MECSWYDEKSEKIKNGKKEKGLKYKLRK